MADEKKNAITEKEALECARDFLEDAEVAEFSEVIEKLEKMIEQRNKKREYKPNPEKRDANLARGAEFIEGWTDDVFKSTDVKIVLGINQQQANAVCKTMVDAGAWKVVPSVESVKVYAIA